MLFLFYQLILSCKVFYCSLFLHTHRDLRLETENKTLQAKECTKLPLNHLFSLSFSLSLICMRYQAFASLLSCALYPVFAFLLALFIDLHA